MQDWQRQDWQRQDWQRPQARLDIARADRDAPARKTVGRHYAGPTWQHVDGSSVVGKVVGTVPGKTAADIPWLKLSATARKGQGMLSGVSTVQRINTQGGVHSGPCDKARTFYSAPYSADYVFLQKGG